MWSHSLHPVCRSLHLVPPRGSTSRGSEEVLLQEDEIIPCARNNWRCEFPLRLRSVQMPRSREFFAFAYQTRCKKWSCARNDTTTDRTFSLYGTHILRFSLDRIFAHDDTAIPDSGERGSASRTGSRMLFESVGHETSRVLSKTNRARTPASCPHAKRRSAAVKAVW
jgi:hypothetical protein